MIYNTKCKLCNAEFRANGIYNHNAMLYEHLKKEHRPFFNLREKRWNDIRRLEKLVDYDNYFIQD